ncbi:MAG: helix-turn-helix domain-containing protein [Longimicrobiales bacterium]
MDALTADRKALLKAKGLTLSGLAKRYRVTKGHLSRVLAGERRSPRLERHVAARLGLPLREVFPEWYRDERVA